MFLYSEYLFIIIIFFTIYYAIYLKMNHWFNRTDLFLIHLSIIGCIFNILAFIKPQYILIEIGHITLATTIFLGSILYSSEWISYIFVLWVLYLLPVRYYYDKCPYYIFYPILNEDGVVITSSKFNNMCFILSFAMVCAKTLARIKV